MSRDEARASVAMIWKPIVIGLMLVGAGGSAVGLLMQYRQRPSELRLPGTVEVQEVRLSSRVGGRVAKILTSESATVAEGQPIVELEMPELDAQRAQLVAQKATAQAVLERLENGPREEEKAAAQAALDAAEARLARMEHGYRAEEVEQARQELHALQADLENATSELNRERNLYAKNATTLAAYDAAQARHSRLQAQANAAEAKVRMMESGYRREEVAEAKAQVAELRANYELLLAGTRQEQIDEARAKVAELAARIAETDVNRQERTVVAAEKCIVETLLVRPGDIVAPNQPVALVLRADDLWVKAYISEINLGRIRLGQKVQVTCDAYPGKRFEGEITHISTISEFTPRNVQTIDERHHQVFGFKVRVTDPQGVFKSGMAADVWLPLKEAKKA
jgi:multidrug resistance efflux pump